MSENSSNGSEMQYLINYRNSLWQTIRTKEDICWRFLAFYVPAMAAILGIGLKTIPADVGVIACLVASAWGMLTVLDANYWFNHNLKIVSNIENKVAPYVFTNRLLPPNYRQPRFHYVRSYLTMLRVFSVFVLGVLFLACPLITLAETLTGNAGWVCAFLATLGLCAWLLIEDNTRRRGYAEFSAEATGKTEEGDTKQHLHEELKKVRRFDLGGPVVHFCAAAIIMASIPVSREVILPQIRATWLAPFLSASPFVFLFVFPWISTNPPKPKGQLMSIIAWAWRIPLILVRLVLILGLPMAMISYGLALIFTLAR